MEEKGQQRVRTTLVRPAVLDYKIIKGMPEAVEEQVRACLRLGYALNSELLPMKVDQYNIVAQCVVLYADDEGENNDKTSEV
jgi:hypothetical protein